MIHAKFVKAEKTEKGITYTLKGEDNKTALHEAVDLQGEDCIIDSAKDTSEPKTDEIMAIFDRLIQVIKREHDNRLSTGV